MEKKEKKDVTKIELASGNKDYVLQNLEYMEFIRKNKCKTMGGKNGNRK